MSPCPQRPETLVSEPLPTVWDSHLGPLEEHCELWTAEISLQPSVFFP